MLPIAAQTFFVRNVAIENQRTGNPAFDGYGKVIFSGGATALRDSRVEGYADFVSWKVDLEESYLIERILLFQQNDQHSNKRFLDGFDIEIRSDDGALTWERHSALAIDVNGRGVFSVEPPVRGNSVRIKIDQDGEANRFLNIEEIKIHGSTLYNAAFGMEILKVSPNEGALIDDSMILGRNPGREDIADTSVAMTSSDHLGLWWKVELGTAFTIHCIKFKIHPESYPSKLTEYKLTIRNAGNSVHSSHQDILPNPAYDTTSCILPTYGDEVIIKFSSLDDELSIVGIEVFTTEKPTFVLQDVDDLRKVFRPVGCESGSMFKTVEYDDTDASQLFYYISDERIGSYGCNTQKLQESSLSVVSLSKKRHPFSHIRVHTRFYTVTNNSCNYLFVYHLQLYDHPGTIEGRNGYVFTAECSSLSIIPSLKTVPPKKSQQWIQNKKSGYIESVDCPGSAITIPFSCIGNVKLANNSVIGDKFIAYEAIGFSQGYFSSTTCMAAGRVVTFDDNKKSFVLSGE